MELRLWVYFRVMVNQCEKFQNKIVSGLILVMCKKARRLFIS